MLVRVFMLRFSGLRSPSPRRLAFSLVPAALAVSMSVVGACESDPPVSVLQALDTQPVATPVPFHPNLIADPGSFSDFETLAIEDVRNFFAKTPYGSSSFLATYQSNGIRAPDAVANAARHYRINPLVFLVFAQAAQGLVGEPNYPFPPDRVEYVFRCGCLEAKSCLPELAGFDRQVDCLGRALREAVDQIKVNAFTLSGWGPNKSSLTLDNVTVTPDNEATAALYDRTPRVNQGAPGGTWLFWNIWNLYAQSIAYRGPIGTIDGRWIGEACSSDAACGPAGAVCATDYRDGLCTVSCTSDCPSEVTKRETFCVKYPSGGFCFPKCDPNSPQCRAGYKCERLAGMNDGAEYVCTPE